MPRETERRCLALEGAAHLAEPRRVSALEREDRLLLVADGEQRAELLACPGAGEELGGKRLDDAPLRRVGVLRLVNQDVVDAAVDLVQHPGGGVGARQQRLGLYDQIVIVERGFGQLASLVIGLHGVCETEHRRARF